MKTKPLHRQTLITSTRLLPLGKSVIQVEQAHPEADAFVDGLQAGHLACRVSWCHAPISESEVILFVVKQRDACRQSCPFFWQGFLVGRLATLAQHGRVRLPTGPSFTCGQREGFAAACQYHQRVLTLTDLCTLLGEPHGTDSAQQAGYCYGLLKGLTQGMRTVPPIIPGEDT